MPPKRAQKIQQEAVSIIPSEPPAALSDIKESMPETKRKRVSARQSAAAVIKEEREEQDVKDEISPPPLKRSRLVKKQAVIESDDEDIKDESIAKPTTKGKTTTKKPKAETEAKTDGGSTIKKRAPAKQKTKEAKEEDMQPLKARNLAAKMVIGAHVSAAGGVGNAVTNSLHIGANAFALFLKSQRKWANPPLDPAATTIFLDKCKHHAYDQNKHVVPHGSYLVNLAHTDKARTAQAYDSFLDDLQRCEKLGIKLYNFHPGNALQTDRAIAIAHLASNLNRAHKATSSVITLLENMAAGGNVLGSTFEDLRDIIAHIDDKSRVGVCLDTCHAFAGGYDLRDQSSLSATLDSFDKIVGIKYLRALHLNDSKAPFSSHRDLHANIGTGFLGLRAFHAVVNESRFQGLPMVLETPIEVRDDDGNVVKDDKGKVKEDKGIWAAEIEMLEGLVGMDVESEEFRGLEEKLKRKGEPERKRIQEQVDKKDKKNTGKKTTTAATGKKGVKRGKKTEDTDDDDDSEDY